MHPRRRPGRSTALGEDARHRGATAAILVGISVLAVSVRLHSLHASGGLDASLNYDEGVYFAATNAFLHGLQPYRDFVFLHPPGILLVASGPVWLAHQLGLDDAGTLTSTRVSFVVLGAVNTVLVYLAGRHLSRATALTAALLYAAWLPAVRIERAAALLEPVVVLGTLAALALIPPISNLALKGRWRPVLAGIVGGVAIGTKLWAVVPILVIAVALVGVGAWRRAAAYLACTAVTVALLLGPFFAVSGSKMWQMVVADQLGRPPMGDSLWHRLALVLGMDAEPAARLIASRIPAELQLNAEVRTAFFATDRAHLAVAGMLVIVSLLAVLAAVRLPVARIWVVLLVVQVGVLITVPTFFVGYAQFAAPALVLVVGAGAHLAWTALRGRGREATYPRTRLAASVAAATLLTVGLASLAVGTARTPMGQPFPSAMASAVDSSSCVAADFPTDLALTNTLSRNLANGCAPIVDFTGMVYVMDHPTEGPITTTDLRHQTPQFQEFAVAYFASADHVILRRWIVDGLSRQTLASVRQRERVYRGPPRVFGPALKGQPSARTKASASPAMAAPSMTSTTG